MRPQIYILNIRSINWDECDRAKIFETRGANRSVLERGDVLLVRRTGKDYGCLRRGISLSDISWSRTPSQLQEPLKGSCRKEQGAVGGTDVARPTCFDNCESNGI
jgi:hypothetical protein